MKTLVDLQCFMMFHMCCVSLTSFLTYFLKTKQIFSFMLKHTSYINTEKRITLLNTAETHFDG